MKSIKSISEFNELIDKKVMIIFYADWSNPSKILLEEIKDIEDKLPYDIFLLNTDSFMMITRRYHITMLPNIKIFNKSKVILECSGLKTKDELLEIFNKEV